MVEEASFQYGSHPEYSNLGAAEAPAGASIITKAANTIPLEARVNIFIR